MSKFFTPPPKSDKKVYKKWLLLSFKGRANRSQIFWGHIYIVLAIMLFALPFFLMGIADQIFQYNYPGEYNFKNLYFVGGVIAMVLGILPWISLSALIAKRLHDIGLSAKWGFLIPLLLLLPVVPLYLWPSQKKDNKWGPVT